MRLFPISHKCFYKNAYFSFSEVIWREGGSILVAAILALIYAVIIGTVRGEGGVAIC